MTQSSAGKAHQRLRMGVAAMLPPADPTRSLPGCLQSAVDEAIEALKQAKMDMEQKQKVGDASHSLAVCNCVS
jgi:hypothetical protein